MKQPEPGMTLELADYVMGRPKGRYRIVFGLGSTVSTATFDIGWHSERDDDKAVELLTGLAKAMEQELRVGTREVVFLSCEYSEQPEEPDEDLG